MRLNTHLTFNGQCREAFQVYAQYLAGEITAMVTFNDVRTDSSAAGFGDKILHATLKVGDQRLTGADLQSAEYQIPKGFAVQLNIDDPDQAKLIFEAFIVGGVIQFPLQKTFWAKYYGLLTDRFGIPWEINC